MTQIGIVEVEAPLAGIGLGDALKLKDAGVPKPVNEACAVALVSCLMWPSRRRSRPWRHPTANATVLPAAAVQAVAGLAAPRAWLVRAAVAV